jgi:SAM-dependent methyltransferase
VQAIDTVGDMIELTRRSAAKAGLESRLSAQVEDAHHLPWNDETFDLVIAMGVTPYLRCLQQALREMVRVLKSGGFLIINADNPWRLNYLLDPLCFPVLAPVRRKTRAILEMIGLCKPACHLRSKTYSRRKLETLLGAAGLDKLDGITLGFGPFSFFNRKLLPDTMGISVNNRLQELADRGFPVLRSVGAQNILITCKPAEAGKRG